LDPKNDLAFKKIFGEEKHKNIPISFLNAVLHLQGEDQILDLEFINTIQAPDVQSQKESVVDVLVKDQRGSRYIVEMQVSKTPGFEKRAQYYAAKTYSSQLCEGGKYSGLKEIVFLAITSYVVFPNKTNYKSEHVILDKKTHSQDLKDFSFTFVELPKFTKKEEELKTIEDQWYYFFKYARESNQIIPALASNSEIVDAYDIVERFGWTESELRSYDRNMMALMDARCRLEGAIEEGLEKGLKQGIQQGLQQGIQQGMQQGIQQGIQQGMQQGIQQGMQQGIQQGMQQGIQQGMQQGIQQGREEGIQEGIHVGQERGREEERKKVIQNLLAKRFPLATISEITGYGENEIASMATEVGST
jgi:predicted transposase/invertase (TIGR01784 family)